MTTAYDNREDYNKTPTRENRIATLQAAATDLLTSLFASVSARDRPAVVDGAADGSAAAERAAADAARAVDPSHFSDEAHFPTLLSEAAAAAGGGSASLGSSWATGASASLTNGALRGPAARINFSLSLIHI